MKTLIADSYLIDPASRTEGRTDILISEGRIEKLGRDLRNEYAGEVEVIDAKGLIAAPGLVDIHSHFRDPGFTYKEDIESGSRAAARGGYTSIVLMANTKPAVDNEETLQYVLEKGKKTGIHIYSCATVTRGMQGKELVSMEKLKRAGAVGFTDDGVPILEESMARNAMEMAAALDVPISFHEENPVFIANNGINKGKASEYFQVGGSDRMAEIDLVGRDLQIALQTGACIDIQHISSREAVELVREAKKKGSNIHAEATPHHFTLTEEALLEKGTLAKMNPPLRRESDRMAVIEGLKDGTIDVIATDHAPHSREEKEKTITEAPSGIIGLETALSLGLEVLVEENGMTLMSYLEKLTCNPAKMYHLDAGYVAAGGPADLVLFDKEEFWTAGDYASKSTNTPFTGRRMKGVVKYTICGGRVIYKG